MTADQPADGIARPRLAPNSASRQRTPAAIDTAALAAAGSPIVRLPIEQIDIAPNRLRKLKPEHAAAIGAVMVADGQYQPITVTRLPGSSRYLLVDGLHRLEGMRGEGQAEIDARIRAADKVGRVREEVLSGWARAKNDAFDTAAQVAAMADLYRAPNDGDDEACSTMLQALRWDEATAEALGVHRTTVFRSLKVHRHYSAAHVQLLRERGMADDLMPLVRLAALPPEDFATAMDLIARSNVASIADAMAMLAPDRAPSAIAEKAARSTITKLQAWHPTDRKRFIEQLLAHYDRNGDERVAGATTGKAG